MSQSMLADKIGASQSVISSLESDFTVPNSIMLSRIAEELEVDINELLAEEKIVQNNSGKAIGNIHNRNQVTINNHFPENVMEVLLSNQEKITVLLETQNKLIESILKK